MKEHHRPSLLIPHFSAMNMSRRSAAASLPPRFLHTMKSLFDIIDREKVGYIRLTDILSYWHTTNDDISASMPAQFLDCLKKVTPPNGMLTFERFCAALRLSLSQQSGMTTTTSTPRGDYQQQTSQPTNAQRYQQFPSITHTTGLGDYESYQNLVTRVGQQQQSRTSSGYQNGQTATKTAQDGAIRRVSVPPEPPHRKPESHEKYQKLAETKMESNYKQPPNQQIYEYSRVTPLRNSADSGQQNLQREIQAGVVLRPIPDGFAPLQQKSRSSRNLDSQSRDTASLMPKKPSTNYEVTNALKMWQKSQSEWDIDRHNRHNNYGSDVGLGKGSFHSDPRHNYDVSDKRSVSSRLSDLYDSTPQSHSPPQDPTPTHQFANGVAPSVKLRKKIGSLGPNNDHRRYSSNDFQSHSAATKQKSLLEEEKILLLRGQDVAGRLRNWYSERLKALEMKEKFLAGRTSLGLDQAVHEEKLNFLRAHTADVNRRIVSLMETSEKGFPSNYNLDQQTASMPLSEDERKWLKEQNKQLSQEVSDKAAAISQLQREKRELMGMLNNTRRKSAPDLSESQERRYAQASLM